MGLFSGLEKFGLKSLDKVEVYEDTKKAKGGAGKGGAKKANADLTEPEMLYDKTFTCPVCERELIAKSLRAGKAKLVDTEMDMRPVYQNIDTIKYGAVLCTHCGYAALNSYFNRPMTDTQIRLIQENVSSNYESKKDEEKDVYTYDDALEIHKMSLLSAVVKKGKASEKAFICLKLAWLERGKRELIEKSNTGTPEEIQECKDSEQEYLKEAYKGFVTAIGTESSSKICGMDMPTVSYLCGALAYEIGEYEEAQRTISRVYTMAGVTPRTKEKCSDLKELVKEKLKQA